jgi:hypothetical protein
LARIAALSGGFIRRLHRATSRSDDQVFRFQAERKLAAFATRHALRNDCTCLSRAGDEYVRRARNRSGASQTPEAIDSSAFTAAAACWPSGGRLAPPGCRLALRRQSDGLAPARRYTKAIVRRACSRPTCEQTHYADACRARQTANTTPRRPSVQGPERGHGRCVLWSCVVAGACGPRNPTFLSAPDAGSRVPGGTTYPVRRAELAMSGVVDPPPCRADTSGPDRSRRAFRHRWRHSRN